MKTSQTEFDFSRDDPPRARASLRLGPQRVLPQTNRLPISREAFETSNTSDTSDTSDTSRSDFRGAGDRGDSGGGDGRHEGILEAAATLLVTIAFGLGWAAVELERVELPGTGYDASHYLSPFDLSPSDLSPSDLSPSDLSPSHQTPQTSASSPRALWDLAAARVEGDSGAETGIESIDYSLGASVGGIGPHLSDADEGRVEERHEWTGTDPTPMNPRTPGLRQTLPRRVPIANDASEPAARNSKQ